MISPVGSASAVPATEAVVPPRDHRVILLAVAIMVLVGTAYWQSFSRMVDMWSLMNYEHCWLVVPVSLYVLWRKRHALADTGIEGSAAGVALVALLVILWAVARAAAVQAVEFTAATSLVFAAFWAVAGNQAAKRAAFPLLLLLAAVPVGEILVEPLMNVTASIASALLYVAGVPVLREATFLTLPGGSFEVAEVCSGLRFLLAGGMASLAYAYVTYTGFRKRTLFVAVGAIVLVLANGLRAFIVMFVASATDMRVFAGRDHVYFGMLLFTVIFIGLIFIGERYADSNPGGEPESSRRVAAARVPLGASFAVLLVIFAGPALQYAKAREPLPAVADLRLPELPGCEGPVEWRSGWSPAFHRADYVLRGAYTCGGLDSAVYVAGYARQEQGKELINSSNRVWPYDWRRYVNERQIALGAGKAQQVLVHAPDSATLIWYWYQTGDTPTGSALDVKLRSALQAFTLSPSEATITAVMISSRPDADPERLRDSLEALALAVLEWNRERGE